MWVGARELLNCDWNPARAGEFLSISHGLSGTYRRIVWFTFAAQCWALWNVRNKLTIEAKLISKPSDVMFNMLIYMQQWRMLVKPKDRVLLDGAMDAIRLLLARLRGDSP